MQNFVEQFYKIQEVFQQIFMSDSTVCVCVCVCVSRFFVTNFRDSLYFKFHSSFSGQRCLHHKSRQVIIATPRSARADGPNGDNIPKQRSRKERRSSRDRVSWIKFTHLQEWKLLLRRYTKTYHATKNSFNVSSRTFGIPWRFASRFCNLDRFFSMHSNVK